MRRGYRRAVAIRSGVRPRSFISASNTKRLSLKTTPRLDAVARVIERSLLRGKATKKLGKLYTGRQSPDEPGDVENALFQYVRTFISDDDRVAEAVARDREVDLEEVPVIGERHSHLLKGRVLVVGDPHRPPLPALGRVCPPRRSSWEVCLVSR